MSVFEMGTNFSQSEEHRSLIVKVGAAPDRCFLTRKGIMSHCNMQLGISQVVTRGALKMDRHGYPSSWIHSPGVSSKTKVVADLMESKAMMKKRT